MAHAMVIALVLVGATLAAPAPAGAHLRAPAALPAPALAVPPDVQARVSALAPTDALAHLELAEDIADAAAVDAAGDADRALAIRLACQAGALDLKGLGRSAALFVADVSRDPAQRARMSALATLLGGGPAQQDQPSVEPTAALALSQAFVAYARGQPSKARTALAAPGAAELLDAHPEILAGGSERFLADCAQMGAGVAPVFTPAQAEALNALVAAALAVEPRNWSESLLLRGRAGVPDFDLSRPDLLFGVDVP